MKDIMLDLMKKGSVTPSDAPRAPAFMRGPTLDLAPHKTYRARITLSGFQAFGTRKQIQEKFESLGFAHVTVFMDARELPPDWPAETRSELTQGTTRWGEGVFSHDVPVRIAKPEVIHEVWEK